MTATARPEETGENRKGGAEGVGAQVKALREARQVSQRKLAQLTATTPSFISQLERNLCGANASTLMKIATALGAGINDLFADGEARGHKVLRKDERPRLPAAEGCTKMLLSRRPIHQFEVYSGRFDIGGSTGAEPYSHGGLHEMFVVLKGTVELTLADERFVMSEGDSIEYSTSTPHRTVNVGTTPAEVLWIIAPPTSGIDELDKYRPGKSSQPGASG